MEFARHGTQPSGVAMTFDDLVEFARRGTQPSARVLASNGHHVRTVLR